MHHYISRLFLALLFFATTVGAQQKSTTPPPAAPKAATPTENMQRSALPSEATVNAFISQMVGYEPAITWKIQTIKPAIDPALTEVSVLLSTPQGQQLQTFLVTPDQQYAVIGGLIPFGATPFAPARRELERGAHGPSRGPANAPVMVVEFSDLQCPHCKEAQPTVDRLLSEEPNTRFVFQNFPLPSHNWAFKAASFGDCIGRENNDAFWKFVKAVYDDQQNITESNADEKLTAAANASGANGKTAAICAAEPQTKTRVQQSIELGKSVDVTGTPTLFINGRKVGMGGVTVEELKKMVEYEAKPGK